MSKKELFFEQVKYIATLKAISSGELNFQTLHHAHCVDASCIKENSGEIYQQAYEFVELMIAREKNQSVDDPDWLVYES